MGETFEFETMRLTVYSVEVTDQIPATSGELVAAEGEDLVLVTSHFVNIGNEGQDLSCSGLNDIYMQAVDTEGREMEPLFETHRIPGNPGCNDALLSGQEHDWNFAFRMVEGSEPLALSFTETETYADMVFVNFTDHELAITEG